MFCRINYKYINVKFLLMTYLFLTFYIERNKDDNIQR